MLLYFTVDTKRVRKEVLLTNIAEKLKEARGERTRKEVCESVGISLNALMMYENGKRIPRDEIKVKLASLYGKSVEDLFYSS